MEYLLIALLGAACGLFSTWYLLIPIVTIVAVAVGVAGAIERHSFGSVLADAALVVCSLEASWLASAFAFARLACRKEKPKGRTDRPRDRTRRPPEYER